MSTYFLAVVSTRALQLVCSLEYLGAIQVRLGRKFIPTLRFIVLAREGWIKTAATLGSLQVPGRPVRGQPG